jgi:hypothetical protein
VHALQWVVPSQPHTPGQSAVHASGLRWQEPGPPQALKWSQYDPGAQSLFS